MKRGSTLFLKLVLILLGLIVLGICGLVLPAAISSDKTGQYQPILLGLYLTAIPFFTALYQAYGLLNNIDQDKAFSNLSILGLKNIKLCGLVISGLFLLGMPYIFMVGEEDDAPGVIAIALIIIFASSVIATFAAVLQKLLQNVVDIKAENDLTV